MMKPAVSPKWGIVRSEKGSHMAQYAVLMLVLGSALYAANGYLSRWYAGALVAASSDALGVSPPGDSGTSQEATSRSEIKSDIGNQRVSKEGWIETDWHMETQTSAAHPTHERVKHQ